jgi:hypothetical protein
MGDTGLETATRAEVRQSSPVLLGFDALRSAQVRSNCYQNCYQGSDHLPGVAEALLGRGARGELTDAQMDDATRETGACAVLAPECGAPTPEPESRELDRDYRPMDLRRAYRPRALAQRGSEVARVNAH